MLNIVMVKSVWPQEERRTRLGRKFFIFKIPRKGSTTYQIGPGVNQWLLIKRQMTGVRGKPLLGFLWERQGRAG